MKRARYFIQFERPSFKRVLYGYRIIADDDWSWVMVQVKLWPLNFSITRVSPDYGKPKEAEDWDE